MKSIYVSNLSEHTKESDLKGHFSKFGLIKHCKTFSFKDGRCKGFAKLTVQKEETFKKIMENPRGHFIQGKKINLEPFVDNRELMMQRNIEQEERKVCILGLPKSLEETEFREIFEIFGGVEKAYFRASTQRESNFGFIVFRERESANKAIAKASIFLPKYEVILTIKKFRSNRGLKKKKKKKIPQENSRNFIKKKGGKRTKKLRSNERFDYDPIMNLRPGNDNILPGYPYKRETSYHQDQARREIYTEGKNFPKKKSVGTLDQSIKQFKVNFMPRQQLKRYLKMILSKNQSIKWINPNDLPKLELFYWNKKGRKDFHLFSLVFELRLKIDMNHSRSNLRLRKSCGEDQALY